MSIAATAKNVSILRNPEPPPSERELAAQVDSTG